MGKIARGLFWTGGRAVAQNCVWSDVGRLLVTAGDRETGGWGSWFPRLESPGLVHPAEWSKENGKENHS